MVLASDYYVSYFAADTCTNNFTPQQTARMHCYLDLVYEPWQSTRGASVPPLSPLVQLYSCFTQLFNVSLYIYFDVHIMPHVYKSYRPSQVAKTTTDSVQLSWVEPFRTGTSGINDVCKHCQPDGSLVQYAVTASSPNPSKGTAHWAPHQATGPPDAETCMPSTLSWMPDVYVCDEPCYIVLGFKYPVVPRR